MMTFELVDFHPQANVTPNSQHTEPHSQGQLKLLPQKSLSFLAAVPQGFCLKLPPHWNTLSVFLILADPQ